jgi:hypothetical protein
VLVLQWDSESKPLHVVSGIPREIGSIAVLVTAYRPDVNRWRRFQAAEAAVRRTTKLVREGRYAAEVPIDLIEDETGWSPYIGVDDAAKLDIVRSALRKGNLATAAKHARLFELLAISA